MLFTKISKRLDHAGRDYCFWNSVFKCFRDEEIENYIYDRLSKYINILSVILIAVAVTLLPDSATTMINEKYQGIAYFLSFLCWFMGAYFESIKSEHKKWYIPDRGWLDNLTLLLNLHGRHCRMLWENTVRRCFYGISAWNFAAWL